MISMKNPVFEKEIVKDPRFVLSEKSFLKGEIGADRFIGICEALSEEYRDKRRSRILWVVSLLLLLAVVTFDLWFPL